MARCHCSYRRHLVNIDLPNKDVTDCGCSTFNHHVRGAISNDTARFL